MTYIAQAVKADFSRGSAGHNWNLDAQRKDSGPCKMAISADRVLVEGR